jgi:hypothetical protein
MHVNAFHPASTSMSTCAGNQFRTTIGEFLITHALDEFKYHIKNAHKKSAIRRAIERPFCKVNEIEGLYNQMVSCLYYLPGAQHREVPIARNVGIR